MGRCRGPLNVERTPAHRPPLRSPRRANWLRNLGLPVREAAVALASGAIEAATASGGEALIPVRDALPDECTERRAMLV